MYSVAEVLFWISLIIIIYTYAGYPLLLHLLTGLKKSTKSRTRVTERQPLPPVTLIVAAYNEEEIIREKIRNTQELDYPAHLLDVIFITDGSTDKTPGIISEVSGYRLLHSPERRGKLDAMNRAVEEARSEIVIFSDANGYLNTQAIKQLVRHYVDPVVGGVSGEKKILCTPGSVGAGEGLYWKYESHLKKLDAALYSVVGAAGELFSIRKHLYTKLPDNVIIEDFVQSLLLCRKGYIVRYEPAAFSAEYPSVNVSDEMERKIRITAGGFQAMIILRDLFNVFRFPMLSFLFISHRVLRWTLCPLSLIIAFTTAWILYLLSGTQEWLLVSLLQSGFYLWPLQAGSLPKLAKRCLFCTFPSTFSS